MKFRNIIFDLDGTLVDSARITGRIIDAMLAEQGVTHRADRDLIRQMDAVGGEAMIAAVMGDHASDPAAALADFRARHAVIDVPHDLPFAGVRTTLADLRKSGARLAICSNKPQHLCERILGSLGLADHFEIIVGSQPGRPRKPAPDAALAALSGVAGKREETLYCGDSLIDVLTARRAGLPIVLAEWGYGAAEAIAAEPGLPRIPTMQTLKDISHGNRDLASLTRGGDPG